MAKFYLITNAGRKPPEHLSSFEYVYIKSKIDGSETVIISDEGIIIPEALPLNQADAQSKIDGWISDENSNPELDGNGNPIIQPKISLGSFISNNALNDRALDIAKIQRIERGIKRDGDKELLFKTLIKDLSPMAKELFLERLSKFMPEVPK